MKKISMCFLLCLLAVGLLVGSAVEGAPIDPMRSLPLERSSPPFDLPYNPSHLMVKFQPGISPQEHAALLEVVGGWVEWDYRRIGWQLIRFDMGFDYGEFRACVEAQDVPNIQRFLDIAQRTAEAKAELLRSHPRVDKVEFDYWVEVFDADYTPDDPFFIDVDPVAGYQEPQQWTCFDVQLPEAWDVTQGSEEVIIAIIDSGTDIDHPDLEDNIARWPSGNVRGWDFVGGKDGEIWEIILPVQQDPNPDIHHNDGVDDGWGLPDPSAGDGQDVLGLPSSDCDLGVFHGTFTASCASAVTDNALGGVGAGFNVKIMPVRCVSPEGGLVEYFLSSVSVLTMGVNWAVDNGADIISMSLGLPASLEPAGLHDAIIDAYNQGIPIFAASGNSGVSDNYVPASWPETFAVGSFSQAQNRADFSSYGSWMDCLAGGGQIVGSNYATAEWIWGCYVSSVCDENNGGLPAGAHGFCAAMGTSAACPQAAGIAGLVLSVAPGLSPVALYNVIRQTCLDVEAPGWDEESGWGIIQARDALDLISSPPNVSVTLTPQGSIVIPPGGGPLTYLIEVQNNGSQSAFVDFWEDITLPSGTTTNPVLIRFGLSIAAGQALSRTLVQNVPGGAPAGNYTFNAYLGTYPGIIAAEDHFNFSKSGLDGRGSVGDWSCTGWDEEYEGILLRPAMVPDQAILFPNYPNPFNPSTTISFVLPEAARIKLTIEDISGRQVATLVDGWRSTGTHQVTFDGSGLASGVYIYRLKAGEFNVCGKIILMK